METMTVLETRINKRVKVNEYYSVQIIEVDCTVGKDVYAQYIGLIMLDDRVERVTDPYVSERLAMKEACGWISAQALG